MIKVLENYPDSQGQTIPLTVLIFNKKSHQTQSEECLKLQDPYFAS